MQAVKLQCFLNCFSLYTSKPCCYSRAAVPPGPAKGLAEKLFYNLVQQCYEKDIIIGENIAIDSTAIDAYARKKAKHKQDDTIFLVYHQKF
jgi:hypothetical protein